MSRVSLDGPTNPPNTASERDVRNYTRGRLVPQNITHVRVGDTAYEAQKTRDLHAEVVAPRPSDPGPVGMPVPTDAPPDARYRSDGKPFPGSEKAAPPLPEDAPRGAGMGGSVAINGR